MKKTYWIILFLLTLSGNLAGILTNDTVVIRICKPLLVIILAAYFLWQLAGQKSRLKTWLLCALAFSWIGDVLLLFDNQHSLFFLLGLSAFLLAHVCYIYFFHCIRIQESVNGRALLLVVVVLYYAVLMSILSPFLGSMKLPVRVYGVVISFMLMLAMHMLFINERKAGRWMFTGALLFVISDSVLAVNKFYQPFAFAPVLIMITYGLAQLFITQGAIEYIRHD
jgi:uncharacterized membrane protein YhhN